MIYLCNTNRGEILTKKENMKTKRNADGSLTINSITFEELGKVIIETMSKVEKARKVHEELDMEFSAEVWIGSTVELKLKHMQSDKVDHV